MRKIIPLIVLLFITSTISSQIIKKKVPDKLVVMSFDDATLSQYNIVAPLLKKYGFSATFFVCEFPSTFKDSAIYLNWHQINELCSMGFDIANHTRTHPSVNKLTREQFLDELQYIETKCDSLGMDRPTSFAYPGYGLSLAVLKVLNEKGYRFGRAGGSRVYDPLSDNPLLVPSWATNADNKDQIMKAFQEAKDGKIVVLTIHGVPDIEHPWVNTPPALFEEYLRFLSQNGYKVISFKDLNAYIDTKEAFTKIAPDLTKKLKN